MTKQEKRNSYFNSGLINRYINILELYFRLPPPWNKTMPQWRIRNSNRQQGLLYRIVTVLITCVRFQKKRSIFCIHFNTCIADSARIVTDFLKILIWGILSNTYHKNIKRWLPSLGNSVTMDTLTHHSGNKIVLIFTEKHTFFCFYLYNIIS